MKQALIYTTQTCPYCTNAKRLLEEKGYSYSEIRVDLDEKERDKMVALTGRYTVPQVFLGKEHIGGYDDLYAYFKNLKEQGS